MSRKGLTHDRVVDAAVAIADVDGLDAVTIARLASDLGVRPPSLYNHVSNRQDILRSITLRAVEDATRQLGDATVGRSGGDAVRALAHAYRDFARASPTGSATLIRSPAPDDSELVAAGERLVGLFTAALRGFDLQGDDTIHAVRILRASLHGFVTLESSGGFEMPIDVDASYERLIDTIVGGLEKI